MTFLPTVRRRLPEILAGAGLSWVLVATLDPTRPVGSFGGPSEAGVGTFALGPDWSESVARLPSSRMVTGENVLCLEFQDAVAGADGERLGARVSRIVIH
jgi:hypothetical protein